MTFWIFLIIKNAKMSDIVDSMRVANSFEKQIDGKSPKLFFKKPFSHIFLLFKFLQKEEIFFDLHFSLVADDEKK